METGKKITAAFCSALMIMLLASCSGAPQSASAITVISREDGSGTRGAFSELFGVMRENSYGVTEDITTPLAEITNSTSIMLISVEKNKNAVGYVSLGVPTDGVKRLLIDGVEPSAENIKNGSYTVCRPFNIAVKEALSDVAADFISFVMSGDGQRTVEESGYISVSDGSAYEPTGISGRLAISGSSSVYPVMEKLCERYAKLNPAADVELQQSDSTTGVTDVINGTSDIGMASRELSRSELSAGLRSQVIAVDGISVIVNTENAVQSLTKLQVMSIYTGETRDWADRINAAN